MTAKISSSACSSVVAIVIWERLCHDQEEEKHQLNATHMAPPSEPRARLIVTQAWSQIEIVLDLQSRGQLVLELPTIYPVRSVGQRVLDLATVEFALYPRKGL